MKPGLPGPPRLVRALRRVPSRAFGRAIPVALDTLARAGRLHPAARPERHHVEILRDLPYRSTGQVAHTLDVYRSTRGDGPWPVVLYVHGGAFRFLSKESHWVMGLAFARAGYLVFNINYRLSPRHAYPAPLVDVCAAARWVRAHAADLGGDPERLVVAGESAGGNLVAAYSVLSAYRRPEPWAREIFEHGPHPAACIAGCAILQCSDPGRFVRRRPLPGWLADRLVEAAVGYLPATHGDRDAFALADPVPYLERGVPPDRPLPPFFAFAGTKDPLLDDSRRLKVACDALGTPCELRIYPGELHAFHALVMRSPARRCWGHQLRFLERVLNA